MGGGEGDMAFGVTLGEFLFVERVDGAAGDKLDRHAGLLGEFFGDRFGDKVTPAAAPNADDKFVLRLRGYGNGKGKECKQETFHVQILCSQLASSVLHSAVALFCTNLLGSTIGLILPT